MSSVIINLPDAVSDPSGLTRLNRDTLLDGDLNGVLFLADLANSYGYAGGTPSNGAQVRDLTAGARHADFLLSNGSVAYAGGGFDFTNAGAPDNSIRLPASVSALLWGGGSSLQYWLSCLYVKLPSSGDWNPGATFQPMLQFASTGYNVGSAEHHLIAQQNTPALSFRRSTGSGTVDILSMLGSNLTPHYGLFTQLAIWRNATEFACRMKSAGGTTSSTMAPGSANAQNFSALRGRIGVQTASYWGASGTARNFRAYRYFIEDLAVSGRNPTTVLDADYTRTVARGVFS